ncbi:MAG: aldo/keto reductase [Actinomycetota bacterium]|jgi:aryl-alcohol dehydrogenase-like predicted oxidoreductase|nr:aldo/keto reductase [Actinomycetota bacterium]
MEDFRKSGSENGQSEIDEIPLVGFGSTGLSVSRLGFGGHELAGPPRAPDLSLSEAVRVVHAAMDLGITYFDTSIDYDKSEEVLGAAFKNRRGRVVIATKCGCPLGDQREEKRSHSYTPENISAGVAQSLKRLGTDYIDVMQLHGNPTPEKLQQEGGLEVLLELQRKGVIGHIGVSTRKPYVDEFVGSDFSGVFQLPYSALQRLHEDTAHDLAARGKAVVARGVTARGSIAKSWASVPIGMKTGQAETIWDRARLDELISPMSRIEFMIRFVATNSSIDVLLTGTTNLTHLEENVKAVEKGLLPPDIYKEALARLALAGSAPGEGEYVSGGPLG